MLKALALVLLVTSLGACSQTGDVSTVSLRQQDGKLCKAGEFRIDNKGYLHCLNDASS